MKSEDFLKRDDVARILDSRFWCDKDGNVYSQFKTCVKPLSLQKIKNTTRIDGNSYLRVKIGKYGTHSVSRIMGVAWGLLDDFNSELEIDHIDDNRENNKLSNLQALTHAENIKKRRDDGLFNKYQNKKITLKNVNTEEVYEFDSQLLAAKWLGERYNRSFGTYVVELSRIRAKNRGTRLKDFEVIV